MWRYPSHVTDDCKGPWGWQETTRVPQGRPSDRYHGYMGNPAMASFEMPPYGYHFPRPNFTMQGPWYVNRFRSIPERFSSPPWEQYERYQQSYTPPVVVQQTVMNQYFNFVDPFSGQTTWREPACTEQRVRKEPVCTVIKETPDKKGNGLNVNKNDLHPKNKSRENTKKRTNPELTKNLHKQMNNHFEEPCLPMTNRHGNGRNTKNQDWFSNTPLKYSEIVKKQLEHSIEDEELNLVMTLSEDNYQDLNLSVPEENSQDVYVSAEELEEISDSLNLAMIENPQNLNLSVTESEENSLRLNSSVSSSNTPRCSDTSIPHREDCSFDFSPSACSTPVKKKLLRQNSVPVSTFPSVNVGICNRKNTENEPIKSMYLITDDNVPNDLESESEQIEDLSLTTPCITIHARDCVDSSDEILYSPGGSGDENGHEKEESDTSCFDSFWGNRADSSYVSNGDDHELAKERKYQVKDKISCNENVPFNQRPSMKNDKDIKGYKDWDQLKDFSSGKDQVQTCSNVTGWAKPSRIDNVRVSDKMKLNTKAQSDNVNKTPVMSESQKEIISLQGIPVYETFKQKKMSSLKENTDAGDSNGTSPLENRNQEYDFSKPHRRHLDDADNSNPYPDENWSMACRKFKAVNSTLPPLVPKRLLKSMASQKNMAGLCGMMEDIVDRLAIQKEVEKILQELIYKIDLVQTISNKIEKQKLAREVDHNIEKQKNSKELDQKKSILNQDEDFEYSVDIQEESHNSTGSFYLNSEAEDENSNKEDNQKTKCEKSRGASNKTYKEKTGKNVSIISQVKRDSTFLCLYEAGEFLHKQTSLGPKCPHCRRTFRRYESLQKHSVTCFQLDSYKSKTEKESCLGMVSESGILDSSIESKRKSKRQSHRVYKKTIKTCMDEMNGLGCQCNNERKQCGKNNSLGKDKRHKSFTSSDDDFTKNVKKNTRKKKSKRLVFDSSPEDNNSSFIHDSYNMFSDTVSGSESQGTKLQKCRSKTKKKKQCKTKTTTENGCENIDSPCLQPRNKSDVTTKRSRERNIKKWKRLKVTTSSGECNISARCQNDEENVHQEFSDMSVADYWETSKKTLDKREKGCKKAKIPPIKKPDVSKDCIAKKSGPGRKRKGGDTEKQGAWETQNESKLSPLKRPNKIKKCDSSPPKRAKSGKKDKEGFVENKRDCETESKSKISTQKRPNPEKKKKGDALDGSKNCTMQKKTKLNESIAENTISNCCKKKKKSQKNSDDKKYGKSVSKTLKPENTSHKNDINKSKKKTKKVLHHREKSENQKQTVTKCSKNHPMKDSLGISEEFKLKPGTKKGSNITVKILTPEEARMKRQLVCKFCHQFSSFNGREVIDHIKTEHKLKCFQCKLIFASKEEVQAHRNTFHLTEKHHCLLCEREFTTIHHYLRHLQSRFHHQLETAQKRAIDIVYRACKMDAPANSQEQREANSSQGVPDKPKPTNYYVEVVPGSNGEAEQTQKISHFYYENKHLGKLLQQIDDLDNGKQIDPNSNDFQIIEGLKNGQNATYLDWLAKDDETQEPRLSLEQQYENILKDIATSVMECENEPEKTNHGLCGNKNSEAEQSCVQPSNENNIQPLIEDERNCMETEVNKETDCMELQKGNALVVDNSEVQDGDMYEGDSDDVMNGSRCNEILEQNITSSREDGYISDFQLQHLETNRIASEGKNALSSLLQNVRMATQAEAEPLQGSSYENNSSYGFCKYQEPIDDQRPPLEDVNFSEILSDNGSEQISDCN